MALLIGEKITDYRRSKINLNAFSLKKKLNPTLNTTAFCVIFLKKNHNNIKILVLFCLRSFHISVHALSSNDKEVQNFVKFVL